MLRRIDILILVAACAVYGWGAVRLLSVADEGLISFTIVDDALYYLVPARHFLSGNGYALDGIHRSNGVQPLWAILTVGLVALADDPSVLLRLAAGVGGGLWLGAGILLYVAIRRFNPMVGAVAATGFLITGFGPGLAFSGMEAGLHSFLFAALLATGVRAFGGADNDGAARWAWPALGALAALFSLARVDSALLVVLAAPVILFGILRLPGDAERGRGMRNLVRFAFPVLVLCGGWLSFSQAYFGEFAPISGTVKRYNEKIWDPVHATNWKTLRWTATYVYDRCRGPIVDNAEWTAWNRFGRSTPAERLKRPLTFLIGAGLATALVIGGLRATRTHDPPPPLRVFLGLMIAFVVLRFSIVALLLPHYTHYCFWYFGPECMLVWALMAAGFGGVAWLAAAPLVRLRTVSAGVSTALIGGCAGWILLAAAEPLASPDAARPVPNPFATAGQWAAEHLPAGARASALSAGWLAYFARPQRVTNLDGLINDRTFFENYLTKNRLLDYTLDERIEFFADLAPLRKWSEDYYLPRRALELVRWWRYQGDDGGTGYGLWRIRDPAEPAPRDGRVAAGPITLSQLHFDAEVLDRYRVVDADELPAVLATSPTPLRVLSSIIHYPAWGRWEPRLRHVVVTPEQARDVALALAAGQIARPVRVEFGDGLGLRGIELVPSLATRGKPLVLARVWQRHGGDAADCEIETTFDDGRGNRWSHVTAGCHETHPTARWGEGEVVSEAYEITPPAGVPPGEYSVWLSVSCGSARLPASSASTPILDDRALVGGIRVR